MAKRKNIELSAWQVVAIQVLVQRAAENGTLEQHCGKALAELLASADKIVLKFK